ncbi:hypothetical protein PI125_g5551 [Phytophthora idaei]|nr:hypothetical protein PI125_g5551 [Phytophthora idaei]
MIQIVEIQMKSTDSTKQKLWATFYDPLGIESNLEICQAKWLSLTLPMLQQWFNRDLERTKLLNLVPQKRSTRSTSSSMNIDGALAEGPLSTFPSVHVVNMIQPTQVDGVSCGVLCAAVEF